MTTLVVTNDFPPRIGGIESFVREACAFLDDDVVVLTSTAPGADGWDAAAGFPIARLPGPLLPTAAVGRVAADLLRRHRAERVLFGAAAPLALLTPVLRAAGAHRVVALSHGHETWWATLPGTRSLLRRIGTEVDVLTTISDYVEVRLAAVLSSADRAKLVRLPPPVDLEVFRPAPTVRKASRDGGPSSQGGLAPAQHRVVAVGRMVRRKGFDTLLTAWDLLQRTDRDDRTGRSGRCVGGVRGIRGIRGIREDRSGHCQGCELVLVGDGPRRGALERQVERSGLAGVVFTGALDRTGVLAELQRADVFALPVRTRLAGLDPEGLGLAALEAAACRLPVLVGRSGGAPETVRHGRTGYLVDPDDPYEIATRLADLLGDPDHAGALGAAGRVFAGRRYGAERARRVLRNALHLSGVATV